MGQLPLYNFFTDMNIKTFCSNCFAKYEKSFNLKKNQVEFKIDMISFKCVCGSKVIAIPTERRKK